MTTREAFEYQVRDNWAAYFGLETPFLQTRTTRLFGRKSLEDKRRLDIYRIGEISLVELDPGLVEATAELLRRFPEDYPLMAMDLLQAWGQERVEIDITHLYYLYPPDFMPFQLQDGNTQVRQLSVNDSAAFRALIESALPAEVEEAYIALEHELVYGAYQGDLLVAAASMFDMHGFVDPGVLTHPSFRREGLAKAVISPLCAAAIQQGRVMQYRAGANNTASNAIAKALGFRHFFTNEDISLR